MEGSYLVAWQHGEILLENLSAIQPLALHSCALLLRQGVSQINFGGRKVQNSEFSRRRVPGCWAGYRGVWGSGCRL